MVFRRRSFKKKTVIRRRRKTYRKKFTKKSGNNYSPAISLKAEKRIDFKGANYLGGFEGARAAIYWGS